ncbi:glycerate kinase [Curtobacterium sp. L1-20]|uniref:glycerate kinase n=1 Tax=Curtobacterium sp. L1-20 TaxID=3138181 RepID=UPI003B51F045
MSTARPHVLVAPDKFKGSLTSEEAGAAIAAGIRRRLPHARITFLAVADGGEGTVAVAVAAGAEPRSSTVRDPLGRPVRATWALDGRTAVIELAEASGLRHVTPTSATARNSDTFGTGELILAALDAGADEIIIGVGGSATTDGGSGALRALGARILKADGREITAGGVALRHASRLDLRGLDARLADVRLRIACDVDNTLTGPRGAASVYGPQKGASKNDVQDLEAALVTWGGLLEATTSSSVSDITGSGAAGGFPAAFIAAAGARIEPGFSLIAELTDFENELHTADLVIIGEGSFDDQSLQGKAPIAIAARARAVGTPVLAVAGRIEVPPTTLAGLGIHAVGEVREVAESVEDGFTRAALHVASAAALATDRWLGSAAHPHATAGGTASAAPASAASREKDPTVQHHRHLHPPLPLPNIPEVPEGARLHEVANRPLQEWVIRTALRTRPDTVEWVLDATWDPEPSDEPPLPSLTAATPLPATAAREALAESMRGRTMFVVPYRTAAADKTDSSIGVLITDSPVVVRALRAELETGQEPLDEIGPQTEWAAHLHTIGLPVHTKGTERTQTTRPPAQAWVAFDGPGRVVIGADPDMTAHIANLVAAGGAAA